MGEQISALEEIYKVVGYKGLYQGKELVFKYEQHEFRPLPQLRIVRYGNKSTSELPEGLVQRLTKAIEGIEDSGKVKTL